MKSAPQYQIRKVWINFIDLQKLDVSYCAIGIYVCCTANKQKEFSIDELAVNSGMNTAFEIQLAIEELLEAGLVELMPAAVMQGGGS